MTPKKKASDFEARIQAAFEVEGPAVDLGRPLLADQVFPKLKVQVPTSTLNRHGLIAGATGTGKTRSLQLMAEQLSDLGVPVFAADMKGDLGGLMQEGDEAKVKDRAKELGIEWSPAACPVSFFSLGGVGPGIPLRATVSSFGPLLMGKVLEANETQASSLALVFHYADEKGLPLIDLSDLRSLLQFLTGENGKEALKGIGGLSSATAGVLLRKIIELDQQGAEAFFGEPQIEVTDLLATTGDGKGVISCLELPAIQDRPKVFSTFLMWLLAELFHELPEVGDLPKPKLVFFFDEAHFLFEEATKSFLAEVTQTVRLIRSKGVGIFFVTQLPDDVPDDILAQLGNRVQHAIRAYTPRDAKALKATVSTFPKTDDYDLEEELTRLGTGEAMVTVLDPRGVPSPVVWTRIVPPRSSMSAIDTSAIDQAAKASPLWPKLAEEINRESAEEKIAARLQSAREMNIQVPPPSGRKPRRSERQETEEEPPPRRGRGRRKKGYLETQEGRRTLNVVLRGVFGLLRRSGR
jgi:DNA helicase HerA-like ATPase